MSEENVVKKAVKKSSKKAVKKAVKETVKKTPAKKAVKTEVVNVSINQELVYPKNGSSGFTQGVPEAITTSISMKVVTRPYENIDLFASVTQRLVKDADMEKAFAEGFEAVKAQINPKILAIREKYANE